MSFNATAINLAIQTNPWIYIPMLLWSLVWKGFGLWKSARAKSIIWFIAILILNTVGILPLVYLLFVEPNPWIKGKAKKKTRKKK